MVNLASYLDCGNIFKNRNAFDFVVTKFSDLEKKIIPFFQKYPVIGIKSKDFEDFSQVVFMMSENKHLTKQGLEEIKKIKTGMNTARK